MYSTTITQCRNFQSFIIINYYYPGPLVINWKSANCSIYYLEYTSLTTSPLRNVTGDVYTSGAEVKINEQTTLNVLSVYLPNGPKGDNTDRLKNIALSNKKWLILGDFNAPAPFWEKGCATVTCDKIILWTL